MRRYFDWLPGVESEFKAVVELHSQLSYSRWGTPSEEQLNKFFAKMYHPLLVELVSQGFRSHKSLGFYSEEHKNQVLKGLTKLFSTCKLMSTYEERLMYYPGYNGLACVDLCGSESCQNTPARFRWKESRGESVLSCTKCKGERTQIQLNNLSPKEVRKINETIKRSLQGKQATDHGEEPEELGFDDAVDW